VIVGLAQRLRASDQADTARRTGAADVSDGAAT
jgi:hypothetical protein